MPIGVYERTPDMMTGKYERWEAPEHLKWKEEAVELWNDPEYQKWWKETKHTRISEGQIQRYAGMTTEEIVEQLGLRDGMLSDEANRKGGKTLKRNLAKLTSRQMKARMENSCWSRGAIERAIAGRQRFLDSRTHEEKQEDYRNSFGSLEALKKREEGRKSGEASPNWKGGHTYGYGEGWSDIRFFILVRDHFGCQRCGSKESLCVHHIDYDVDNMEDSNLITLCKGCNVQVNGNREYWQDFFTEVVRKKALGGWADGAIPQKG